ncbi:hypothetical protein LXA41_17930, partial [Erwinia amylovora]|uniref:hypothetical protein n=1 Tax=Erwinia amylovora TaxID=552 RepID=UPI0020C0D86C
ERDVGDWHYSRIHHKPVCSERRFRAQVIDVSSSRMRLRQQENGAFAFIHSQFLHDLLDEMF